MSGFLCLDCKLECGGSGWVSSQGFGAEPHLARFGAKTPGCTPTQPHQLPPTQACNPNIGHLSAASGEVVLLYHHAHIGNLSVASGEVVLYHHARGRGQDWGC